MRKILFAFLISALCMPVLLSCAAQNGSITPASKDYISADECFKDGTEFILKNMYEDIKITIGFHEGRIFGFSGVNRYMGSYKASDGKVEFGQMGSTMMAGPEKNMDAEFEYLNLLEGAKTFSCTATMLKIGNMEFEKK